MSLLKSKWSCRNYNRFKEVYILKIPEDGHYRISLSDIAAGETPNRASVVLQSDNSDLLAIVETGNHLLILNLT